jgi:acyl carrier protein
MMVFEKLQEIIVTELGVDKADVTLEADLNDDLGADSLDAVELIMAIEDEFNLSISDDIAQNLKSVKQIVDYIESQQ